MKELTDEKPLVSVITPCYNAERWVRETVESVLRQTYPAIEMIVVDDGSTDNSLQILEEYGAQIQVVAAPHRGANPTINAGLALAKGKYVQFLDADDYLLPEKIAKQVALLEETNADVVYGDWRYQRHLPNGEYYLDKKVISGEQDDVLEALFTDWWVALAALLYKREAVMRSGGWDENRRKGTDRDFFISVVLDGADVKYLPSCDTIYRKYGATSVSSSNMPMWLEEHCLLLEKAENRLVQANKLSQKYKTALAMGFYRNAMLYYEVDKIKYFQLLDKIISLDPDFKSHINSSVFRMIQKRLGFRGAERLAAPLRSKIRGVKSLVKSTLNVQKVGPAKYAYKFSLLKN